MLMDSVSCNDCKEITDWAIENIMTNSNEQYVQDYIASICNKTNESFYDNYELCRLVMYSFPLIWDYICKSLETNKICESFVCKSQEEKIMEIK